MTTTTKACLVAYPHPDIPPDKSILDIEFDPLKNGRWLVRQFIDLFPEHVDDLKTAAIWKANDLATKDVDTDSRAPIRKWIHERAGKERAGKEEVVKQYERLDKHYRDDLEEVVQFVVVTQAITEDADFLEDADGNAKRMQERIKNASGLGGTTSPSDSIKDFNKIKRTVTFPSGPRYGRPSHRFGPPTVLFNDALARLKYDLEHLDKFTPPHQKLCHAFSLTTIAADFHSSDEERFKSLKDPLKELLGTEASWKESVASGSTIPDGLWLEGPFAYMIFELKNEPGLGGDPFLQSLVVYGNAVKQIVNHLSRSNFPVVLLSMAGNNLVVSTAIYTDAVYADKLLSIDLHLGSHGADNVLRVARVFAAIEECTVRLRAQYRLLDNLQNVQPGVMYPSPTADPPEAEIPRLEFICKLDRQSGARLATVDEANERHAIYLARMQTNTAGDASDNLVFVKFTPKYNQEAHRLLANQDPPLAPALFSCNRIIGDMYMVVMEYMSDASPLHLFFSPFTPPCPLKVEVVRKSLEKALGLLHGQDLVFGDLRQLNILYSHKGDCVFLVDFDWVGKHREDRYSPCLNPVVRSDVGRWEVMKKEHDIRSLEGVMEGLGEKVSV